MPARGDPYTAQAVTYAQRTDSLFWQGEALVDLAEVLEAAARRDEATAALREAPT